MLLRSGSADGYRYLHSAVGATFFDRINHSHSHEDTELANTCEIIPLRRMDCWSWKDVDRCRDTMRIFRSPILMLVHAWARCSKLTNLYPRGRLPLLLVDSHALRWHCWVGV